MFAPSSFTNPFAVTPMTELTPGVPNGTHTVGYSVVDTQVIDANGNVKQTHSEQDLSGKGQTTTTTFDPNGEVTSRKTISHQPGSVLGNVVDGEADPLGFNPNGSNVRVEELTDDALDKEQAVVTPPVHSGYKMTIRHNLAKQNTEYVSTDMKRIHSPNECKTYIDNHLKRVASAPDNTRYWLVFVRDGCGFCGRLIQAVSTFNHTLSFPFTFDFTFVKIGEGKQVEIHNIFTSVPVVLCGDQFIKGGSSETIKYLETLNDQTVHEYPRTKEALEWGRRPRHIFSQEAKAYSPFAPGVLDAPTLFSLSDSAIHPSSAHAEGYMASPLPTVAASAGLPSTPVTSPTPHATSPVAIPSPLGVTFLPAPTSHDTDISGMAAEGYGQSMTLTQIIQHHVGKAIHNL